MMTHAPAQVKTPRERLDHLLHHLEHILPAQAPIRDFVHHNTLHGFQHLPFPQAVAAARKVNGLYAYHRPERFRAFFAEGRIDHADLDAVLREAAEIEPMAELAIGPVSLRRMDVVRALMLHAIEPVSPQRLHWLAAEENALKRLRPDVELGARDRLLAAAGMGETQAVADLWHSCLDSLGIDHVEAPQHQAVIALTAAESERFHAPALNAEEEAAAGQAQRRARHEADRLLDGLLDRVGVDLTLGGLLTALTGRDILDDVRPMLLCHLSSFLDQGMAALHSPDREDGFWNAWRRSALVDPGWRLEDLPDWRDDVEALADDPAEAVLTELARLGIPDSGMEGYLERLALEIPGWSGMVLWRDGHPAYKDLVPHRVSMIEYLAVRLVLDHMAARRLCREEWGIEPSLDMIRWHFHKNRDELTIRWALFNEDLPEALAARAQDLLRHAAGDPPDEVRLRMVSALIRAWRDAPKATRNANDHGWRLFVLAQHLGLSGPELRAGGPEAACLLLAEMDRLDDEITGHLWLQAYERHYREQIFTALNANTGRGPWAYRDGRPAAQLVFCMDDREEGIRRHLEELAPGIETLGAAGFFGVALNWRGLDDTGLTPLCPVVVTPSHEVHELPRAGAEHIHRHHVERRAQVSRLRNLAAHGGRLGALLPVLMTFLAAPLGLTSLVARLLRPLGFGRWVEGVADRFAVPVPTALGLNAPEDGLKASPENPRTGFTDSEQADRVEGFLRTIGLTYGFAPLVVLMGHGSTSVNNPHRSAYDCGACSGRHGGPNARVFAAMANRPEIRTLLALRGIAIPDDCWFLGAAHDTSDEAIEWYDFDCLPPQSAPEAQGLRDLLAQACAMSAHERARRFASAPADPSPAQAAAHIAGRSRDPSQARPELGHATNACAFIGRRSISRGAFFDRRSFLISYDPTQDPEGKIVEAILLAAGPVGAGISLEYYFSTVNNDGYGAGTKVTHNVTGMLGVMEGVGSDLRTGLPLQMIEIHEAMRLLVVVEQSTEILTAIYLRQPALQELVGNGWIILAARHPDTGSIHLFRPGIGWQDWVANPAAAMPVVPRSTDWYSGKSGPLIPALLDPGVNNA